MRTIFDKVVIVGIGLIGGSIGMALKKQTVIQKIIGVDINQDNLELAIKLQAIDEGYLGIAKEVFEDADLVILAAPISVNIDLLKKIKPFLTKGTIVTDVGSTKEGFVNKCEEILGHEIYFVGGHPMAGSEIAGVRGADPYLFENAIYILTPTSQTDLESLNKMIELVENLGARKVILKPEEHDLLVATISHMPHLVAASLVNTINLVHDDQSKALLLAAGGFRDTTRIASGNPKLWRDICFNNKSKLLQVIKQFKECIERFESNLEYEKPQEFIELLTEAKEIRDDIPAKLKGYWPFLEEIIVMIPDKPGMIAKVASELSIEGINIDDIEILRVREGEGGSLRLGFASLGSAKRAVQILGGHGIIAREK